MFVRRISPWFSSLFAVVAFSTCTSAEHEFPENEETPCTVTCGENATCVDEAECICNNGFTGDPIRGCTAASACEDDSDCSEHGVCSDTADGSDSRCTCDEGWTGEQCEIEDVCVTQSPCAEHGTCHLTLNGSAICECDEGWTGTHCDIRDACAHSTFCGENSFCATTPAGNSVCICDEGWTGENCDVDDVCVTQEGLCGNNGSCHSFDDGTYTCKCHEGWQGDDCSEKGPPTNYCTVWYTLDTDFTHKNTNVPAGTGTGRLALHLELDEDDKIPPHAAVHMVYVEMQSVNGIANSDNLRHRSAQFAAPRIQAIDNTIPIAYGEVEKLSDNQLKLWFNDCELDDWPDQNGEVSFPTRPSPRKYRGESCISNVDYVEDIDCLGSSNFCGLLNFTHIGSNLRESILNYPIGGFEISLGSTGELHSTDQPLVWDLPDVPENNTHWPFPAYYGTPKMAWHGAFDSENSTCSVENLQ